MAVHEAPNHPDCRIECPNGGYAYYIEPYGPCKTNCNNNALATAISEALGVYGWKKRTSGVVRGLTKRQLKDIARQVRQVPGLDSEANDILDELERLGIGTDETLNDAEWSNAEGIDVLKTLRNAAAGSAVSF